MGGSDLNASGASADPAGAVGRGVRDPSLADAIIPLVVLAVLIAGSLAVFGLDALDGPIQLALILCVLAATLIVRKNGHSWDDIQQGEKGSLASIATAVFILQSSSPTTATPTPTRCCAKRGSGAPGETITVAVKVMDSVVRVEVIDRSGPGVPELNPDGLDMGKAVAGSSSLPILRCGAVGMASARRADDYVVRAALLISARSRPSWPLESV